MKTKIVVVIENEIPYSSNHLAKGKLKSFKRAIKKRTELLLSGWKVKKVKVESK